MRRKVETTVTDTPAALFGQKFPDLRTELPRQGLSSPWVRFFQNLLNTPSNLFITHTGNTYTKFLAHSWF